MVGLQFGGQWFRTQFGNDYGNIELDATLDESHEWTAEATTNPVEEGSPVSDHVIDQADKLNVKGFITDAPIIASQGVIVGEVNDRVQPVFNLLHLLIKAREPMTVYTQFRVYTDMVLTSCTIPRSSSNGEAIEFSLDFINIRKVSTQMVDIPPGISPKKSAKANGSTAKKSDAKKDAGKKQPEEVKTSAALNLAKKVGVVE